MDRAVSRRAFLVGVTGTVAAARFVHAQEVSTVTPKVEKLYKIAGCKEPNDLQFVSEGLWVLDQVDQPTNKAFLVKPEDGTILREIQTEALHASGITYGNGALWIGSTKGRNAQDPPRTMKVDAQTGKTLKSWVTPGAGLYGRMSAARGDTPSGAHGLKWIDGKYWMAVPAANKIFLMEPESGEIVRSIPAPGSTPRTHGLAIDKGMLWVINSDDRAIFKLDPKDGRVLSKVQLGKDDPAPHGLDIDRNGTLWYCDAASSWVCKLV
jgi:outer membrane protein assembly factor BamB